MPIQVELQDIESKVLVRVIDWTNCLNRSLPDPDDPRFDAVTRIDPYDDTVFLQRDIETLITELDTLRRHAASDEDRDYLRRLVELATRVRAGGGLKLRFIGD